MKSTTTTNMMTLKKLFDSSLKGQRILKNYQITDIQIMDFQKFFNLINEDEVYNFILNEENSFIIGLFAQSNLFFNGTRGTCTIKRSPSGSTFWSSKRYN